MFKSRLFRILVCAVLICSLVFNVVSIPSKALVIADDIALGITALLLLAACGMVIVPQASLDISNVGQSFRTSMLDWGKSTDTYDDVVVWIDAFSLYDPSGGDDDGDDSPNETKVKLARGLLMGIAAWVCSTIMAGKVETEGEAVPDGYAFYNGILLEDVSKLDSNGLSYITIMQNEGTDFYFLLFTSTPLIAMYSSPSDKSADLRFSAVTDSVLYQTNNNSTNWLNRSTGSRHPGGGWSETTLIIYTNYDVMCSIGSLAWDSDHWVWSGTDNGIYFSGSDVEHSETTTVEPSIYVGDLPQQIQNGEKDEDDIVIPPEIDYSKLIQDGKTLQQSVTDTMSQLADGTMTYDQYLEMTTPQTGTGDNTNTGSGSDVWNPPENPGQFALDLSNYFPFCIPFDLYDFFACLNADPVAPVIHWEIALPGGSTYPIELDLSPFDSVAQLLRRLQLLLFIVGLAIKTRDLIKG